MGMYKPRHHTNQMNWSNVLYALGHSRILWHLVRTKQGILISYAQDHSYGSCTKHRLPKKNSVAFLRKACRLFVLFFGRRKNTRGTTAACNFFFNTLLSLHKSAAEVQEPIRTRFACKRRASQNGLHWRGQHADCRYLSFSFLHFTFVSIIRYYESVAMHLFNFLKCMYTNCICLSQTLPFFRLVCWLRSCLHSSVNMTRLWVSRQFLCLVL